MMEGMGWRTRRSDGQAWIVVVAVALALLMVSPSVCFLCKIK